MILFSLVCTVRRVPPHFTEYTLRAEVTPGGSVNLTCAAVGSPMPYVRWRRGTVELTPEHSVPVGRNVLRLTNVSQSANYTCVAESQLGRIERDTEVTVIG